VKLTKYSKVFLIFLISILWPVTALSAVEVKAPNISAKAGETITVPISVSDVTGLDLIAVEITLTYDSNILTAKTTSSVGTLTEGWNSSVNIIGGQIVIWLASATAASGSGTLVSVEFQISKDAQDGQISPLTLSKVRFNEGNIATTSIDGVFTVGSPNHPPAATNLYLTPSSPKTTDNLTANYTYNDEDKDIESGTEIKWYKDGVLQSTYNDQKTIPASATAKGQSWYFTVKPKDGKEFGKVQISSSITILNTPPTAPTVSITPSSPSTDDDLICQATGSVDVDGDTISYKYAWYKNGILQPSSTANTVDASLTQAGDMWKCVATPNDGEKDGASAEYQVAIIFSGPPVPTVTSSTHPINIWRASNQVVISWNKPEQPEKITGFSYVLNSTPDTEPDTVPEELALTKIYDGIADGIWYFHIRAQDANNQWGKTAHYGPIQIDTTSPIVTITTPTESNTLTVNIQGIASDVTSGVAKVEINTGEPNKGSNANFNFSVPLREGSNDFTITATDNAGNKKTRSLTITYAPPTEIALLAIEGAVYKMDGRTLAEDGLKVEVTNLTTKITQTSTTGDAGKGRYSVTFIDIMGHKVATIGDKIEAKVYDKTNQLIGLASQTLTAQEIVMQLFTLDVVLGGPTSLNIQPEKVVLQIGEKIQFTVSGVDEDGNPLPIGGEIIWQIDGDIGVINQKGLFAATTIGTGAVWAKAGSLSVQKQITVIPYTYTIELHRGINIIAVPLNPEKKWRLSDLAKLIGDSVSLIIRYNSEKAKFESYTPGTPESSPINALINGPEGYIVMMKKETKVTFYGRPWADESSISAIPTFWGEPGATPSRKAWRDLERLLLEIGALGLPEKSVLLQNFPNPFNPETWIPFELSQDAIVTIRIYDIAGRLVRKLELGNKPAGFYMSKERAAYWNGRNEAGERASSGLYFYTLQANDFTATKRMILVK